MGLMQTVRSAVALASAATADLQATVMHTAVAGAQDVRGEQVTPQAPVARKAIVEEKQRLVRTGSGAFVQSKHKVTFLDPGVVVGLRDKIVLPDGTTGPILETEGFVDSGTGKAILTEVYLG